MPEKTNGNVMTVLGPVPASELSAVRMHEHLHLDQYIIGLRPSGYAATRPQPVLR